MIKVVEFKTQFQSLGLSEASRSSDRLVGFLDKLVGFLSGTAAPSHPLFSSSMLQTQAPLPSAHLQFTCGIYAGPLAALAPSGSLLFQKVQAKGWAAPCMEALVYSASAPLGMLLPAQPLLGHLFRAVEWLQGTWRTPAHVLSGFAGACCCC